MQNNPIGKIETIDEFIKIKIGKSGYIIVTDNTSPNIVHRPNCSHINLRYFKLKVIDNHCKNGQYYWVNNIELGKKIFNASECFICLR